MEFDLDGAEYFPEDGFPGHSEECIRLVGPGLGRWHRGLEFGLLEAM